MGANVILPMLLSVNAADPRWLTRSELSTIVLAVTSRSKEPYGVGANVILPILLNVNAADPRWLTRSELSTIVLSVTSRSKE